MDLLDNQGKEALFDRLVALRKPREHSAAALTYPDPYESLLLALDASARRAPD